MASDDDVLSDIALMSHQQIIERFKHVFGREMTMAERRAFFLYSTDEDPKQSKKT
jgi:hypothetical protein